MATKFEQKKSKQEFEVNTVIQSDILHCRCLEYTIHDKEMRDTREKLEQVNNPVEDQ